jgi:transposase
MSARSSTTPPGVFTVEKHIRGKWVCRRCERLIQAPVPPHIIDKGIPTAGLLVQVLIAKYLDHCRSTGRRASSSAQGLRYRARRWRSGSAPAA